MSERITDAATAHDAVLDDLDLDVSSGERGDHIQARILLQIAHILVSILYRLEKQP